MLLEIGRDALECRVIDENLDGGEALFPHVYGPLTMSAVVAIHAFPPLESGFFTLPPAAHRAEAG